MGLRHLLASTFLLAVGGIAPTALAGDPPAPAAPGASRSEGETPATWGARLASPDLAERRKAAYALWNLGSTADVAAIPLAKAIADVDAYVRDTAWKTLERLKDAAKPAVPAVAALLADEREEVRQSAASLLVKWGPLAAGALDALTAALASEDATVRQLSAAAIGNAGPAAKAASSALATLLDDDVAEVAAQAAGALARIDRVAALGHARREVRIAALQQLNAEFGVPAPVRDALLPLLGDADRDVRAGAAVVLSSALLASDASSWRAAWAKPLLAAARAEGYSSVRGWLTYALSRLPEAAAESVPLLLDWTRSSDPALRAQAVRAFCELKDLARPAKERVFETLHDPDAGVRASSALALPVVAKDDPRAVPALVTLLADADKFAALNAAESLGTFGPAAAPAVPDLARCLERGRHPALRRAAADALRVIGAAAREAAVPVLEKEIAEDLQVPLQFCDALLHLDARPRKDAADRIVGAALGDDEVERSTAGNTLNHAGDRAELLRPGLLGALKDGDATRRVRALAALGGFRPVVSDVRAAVRAATSDIDPAVAAAAKAALEALER